MINGSIRLRNVHVHASKTKDQLYLIEITFQNRQSFRVQDLEKQDGISAFVIFF